MVFKPNKTLGIVIGLVIVLTIISVDVFLALSALGQAIGPGLFLTLLLLALSLPLLALAIYWLFGLVTLRYAIDRNRLVIGSVTHRQVVPMGAILRIVPGAEIAATERFRGVGWPGYMMGYMALPEHGSLYVHSTEPLQRQLVIITDSGWYGISPRDPQRFLHSWRDYADLEPTLAVRQGIEYASLIALPIWRDQWFWGTFLLALVVNIILFGLIFISYSGLPDRIALHFDAYGKVDQVASKVGLLVVPSIGALALLANTFLGILLHYREHMAAYLLMGMAVVIQMVLWVAAFGILAR